MRGKGLFSMIKKMGMVLAIISLVWTVGVPSAGKADAAAVTATAKGYVYYMSNGDLYRTATDGTNTKLLISEFEGYGLTEGGKYLYFLEGDESTTLFRLPLDGSAPVTAFQKDVILCGIDGGFIYYMNNKGSIYRVPVNAQKASEAKLLVDKADVNNPYFNIAQGRIYYHAIKTGKVTWVASKASNGSGKAEWVAAGTLMYSDTLQTDKTSVYLMIDTKPTAENSTNSIVMYSVPLKGGTPKAINAKSPLDYNAGNTGFWINEYFLYNQGIGLDLYENYDFSTGKAYLMNVSGKAIQLQKTSISQAVTLGANKLTYIDPTGLAYVTTLKDNKVVSTKALALSNVQDIRSFVTNGKVMGAYILAEDGIYLLKPDFSLTQVSGSGWDYFINKADVPGIFYVNMDDNNILYWASEDGKTNKSLNTEPVDDILLITK